MHHVTQESAFGDGETSRLSRSNSSGHLSVRSAAVVDDELTRWAVDVMTAWAQQDDDSDFVRARIAAYASEPDGTDGLITGLINLSGLLLSGMEMFTGKCPAETLQAIAVAASRHH